MYEPVTLKELERRAYTSLQKDGIWELCLGCVMLGFIIMIFSLRVGISETATFVRYMFVLVCAFGAAIGFMKWVTMSRLGYTEFGVERKSKHKMFWISLFSLLVVSSIIFRFVIFNLPGYGNGIPQFSVIDVIIVKLFAFTKAMILGSLIGYFLDYPRAYWMGFILGVLMGKDAIYLSLNGYISMLVQNAFFVGIVLVLLGIADMGRFRIRNPRPVQ